MQNREHDTFEQRRRLLGGLGALGLATLVHPLAARAAEDEHVMLPFANGERPLTSSFAQKSNVIVQRTRPPLIETPFDVFDQGVFTPNDRFYVRWHLANIPTSIDPATFKLTVRGRVKRSVSLTLNDLVRKFPRFEIAAVNQCSGNSRGFFGPRVPGGQWANGAMGNARWTGVRLKDLLDHAGVGAGAVQVRFNGLDTGVIPQTPKFMKSLAVDHALDGEVMVAYAMNGEALPLLNGYPLRLVVPGWYATYWVKMLNDIEVLDRPDDNFWTAKAYLVPDNHFANVKPGDKDFQSRADQPDAASFVLHQSASRRHAAARQAGTRARYRVRRHQCASPACSSRPMAGAVGSTRSSARITAATVSGSGRRRPGSANRVAAS